MLTNKQKSALRSMANTLRPIFQVGKEGVSYNLINTLSDPGVGWMSLSGTCGQIRVTHPQTLEIKHRKAMI